MEKLEVESLYLASDVHLGPFQYGNVANKFKTTEHKNDGLILPGDILPAPKIRIDGKMSVSEERATNAYTKFFDVLSDSYRYIYVVLGNHDYWGSSLEYAPIYYKEFFEKLYDNIILLDASSPVDTGDAILVGDTLWTDFHGSNVSALANWGMTMNDSVYITNAANTRGLLASEILNEFNWQLQELTTVIDSHPDRKIVVATHHAPSEGSVSATYKNDPTNAYYYSDLDEFIQDRPQIKAWVHGHMHTRKSYKIGDVCTVYCNAYGYTQQLPIKNWKPILIKI